MAKYEALGYTPYLVFDSINGKDTIVFRPKDPNEPDSLVVRYASKDPDAVYYTYAYKDGQKRKVKVSRYPWSLEAWGVMLDEDSLALGDTLVGSIYLIHTDRGGIKVKDSSTYIWRNTSSDPKVVNYVFKLVPLKSGRVEGSILYEGKCHPFYFDYVIAPPAKGKIKT